MKYKVTEYRTKKAIVRIHQPILTAEERKAREEYKLYLKLKEKYEGKDT